MKKTPEEVVYYIGSHVTQSGYPCLISSLEKCLELGKCPNRQLTELVYKPVAKQKGISLERFNRAICRATQDIWDKSNHKKLDDIVGRHLERDEKPAPRELIFYLYRYLKKE